MDIFGGRAMDEDGSEQFATQFTELLGVHSDSSRQGFYYGELEMNMVPPFQIPIHTEPANVHESLPVKKKVDGSFKKDKPSRSIVDSVHLSTLVATYNQEFAEYSKSRTHVSQLIPNAVWKAVYGYYKKTFPNSPFQEETLKDRLRDTLKELKTGTSNEEDSGRVVVQSEEVLIHLRATDGHASRSILKKRQGIADRSASQSSSATSGANASFGGSDSVPIPSSPSTATGATRSRMLQQQTFSIASLAELYRSSAEKKDVLLQAKLNKQKKLI